MKSNRGFTLIEVMIGLGILSIVTLVSVTFFKLISDQYLEVRERLQAEAAGARAENLLRNYFAHATNIDFTTGVVPAALASTTGVIADLVNYDQIADMAGDWATIAVFWRETQTIQGVGNTSSRPRETAIWYRRPTLTKKGVLFIDGGSVPGSNVAMTPTWDDQFIEGLTFLRIVKNSAGGGYDQTASIDVTLKIRYHPSHGSGFNWCPELDITANASGCGAIQAVHKDLERSFRIILGDNLVHPTLAAFTQNSSGINEERTFGNLYFFSMVNPVQ